jgi:hypothetical protein
MLIFPLVMVGLPVAAVLLLVLVNRFLGIAGLALAGYIDYQLVKFLRGQLSSFVETTDHGMNCLTSTGDRIDYSWDALSAVGFARPHKDRPFLFVYREEGDKLVTIPREYGEFDALVATVKERTNGNPPFQEIALGPGETIQGWLREELGLEGDGDTAKT